MTEQEPSPIKWLKYYVKRYPSAWKGINEVRKTRNKRKLIDWPKWCFCPLSYMIKIVSGGETVTRVVNGRTIAKWPLVDDILTIRVLSSWRETQGIYRIEEEIFESLAETPINKQIPIDILYYMPEWGIYVETPTSKMFDPQAKGFFATLDYNIAFSCPELIILVDKGDHFYPHSLFLFEGNTIKECLDRGIELVKQHSIKTGVSLTEWERIQLPQDYRDNINKILSPFLSLIIYICCESADIKSKEGEGLPNKVRTLSNQFSNLPVYKPRVWEVGYRLGAILNKAKVDSNQSENEVGEHNNHLSPKPHVRRAHWHGYWVGSKEEKKFILKWLHPILVGTNKPDDIVATLRDVL